MSRTWSFAIEGKIPSKKNSYRVQVHPRFMKAILGVSSYFKGRKWWIDTTREVKELEKLVAWTAKLAIQERLLGKLEIRIRFPRDNDIDNVPGAIFDGIEKSGRIANDRQFSRLIVEREDRQDTLVEIKELATES